MGGLPWPTVGQAGAATCLQVAGLEPGQRWFNHSDVGGICRSSEIQCSSWRCQRWSGPLFEQTNSVFPISSPMCGLHRDEQAPHRPAPPRQSANRVKCKEQRPKSAINPGVACRSQQIPRYIRHHAVSPGQRVTASWTPLCWPQPLSIPLIFSTPQSLGILSRGHQRQH